MAAVNLTQDSSVPPLGSNDFGITDPTLSGQPRIARNNPSGSGVTPGSATRPPVEFNPWMAPKNAQGQYLTPTGTVITQQLGGSYDPTGKPSQDSRWLDASGTIWGYDAAGNPIQLGSQPTTTGAASGTSPTNTAYGTNVFSDPATAPYESLLNSRINQLQTPYTPPDFQPAIDYLRSYFQQLQGPAYTDAQTQVMQTQALDPLERAHQADRQATIERFGTHGISPGSGPVEQALENVDNQYRTIRARTQSSFATNAINTQKQQQAQAAYLGPQIANLEQGNFNANQGRLDQAVNLASIIPNLAWQRTQGAQTNSLDPMTLLSLMNSFQSQGAQYGQQTAAGITSILPYLFQYIYGG